MTILRFAPSPNGRLHLGHAYSALRNAELAAKLNGQLLLRFEDTDPSRCRPEYEAGILEDLAWAGVAFAPNPRRQSEHAADYAAAFIALEGRGLVYPCFCARSALGPERDPDGAPLHRGRCKAGQGDPPRWRLDLSRAPRLHWREYGEGDEPRDVEAQPELWGDVVIAARDRVAVYHLAVVVDDALQGVTDVVRGRDLFASTSVHRVLQSVLGLSAPRYRHHRLVLDSSGAKLSKSGHSETLLALRARGLSVAQALSLASLS